MSETCDWNDLAERDGLHYKKFSDVPFTGKTTGRIQGSIKDGKWNGPWIAYHDNGQLKEKGTYKDGNLEGPWVRYWEDGNLAERGAYKDGAIDGPWVDYNKDGTVWESLTGTFKDGEKVDGLSLMP